MAAKRKSSRDTSAPHRPREVFLSHAHQDHAFTTKLAETLRLHGVATWYSERNIGGAQQWHDEIGHALRRCDWFVVVLTPASVASHWVSQEVLYAVSAPRYRRRIVPVLLKRCSPEKLSWVLPNLQMIRFGRSFAAGAAEILRVWGIGYQR